MHPLQSRSSDADDGRILAKAALRAAAYLGVNHAELAAVLGVSPSVISKISRRDAGLPKTPKANELAALFIRLYRALDAITGGADEVSAKWLRAENAALGGRPAELIRTIGGLTGVLAYLDARRALV